MRRTSETASGVRTIRAGNHGTQGEGDENLRIMTGTTELEPVCGKYLHRLKARGRSARTLGNVRNTLGRITRANEGPILYLNGTDLDRWADRRAGEIDSNTLRGEISIVRGFYAWALREGLIGTDPTLRLEAPRLRRTLPRPMAVDRLRQALAGADPRMAAMLALAAYAGLRCIEVARLTWADIDYANGMILARGKGDKERMVPLSPELAAVLALLPGPRRGPVIPRLDGKLGHNAAHVISHQTSGWLHDQEFPETLHQLRHTFGTELLEETQDLRLVQEAMGHASPASTAIYTRVRPERLRTAVQAASAKMAG